MAWISTLVDGILEMLYPTRCALCDKPGALLCVECNDALDLIDHSRACPLCGVPDALMQCTECRHDGTRFAFTACRAIGSYDGSLSRLVRVYKDAGERRLSDVIAHLLATGCGSDWRSWADAVTFVPASPRAFERRGFDHMELVTRAFSKVAHVPYLDLLTRTGEGDQRRLTRDERVENVRGVFSVVDDRSAVESLSGSGILLIDDVFTTGSTLDQAARCLVDAGAGEVRALVLARVW
jgi:ComF family protein